MTRRRTNTPAPRLIQAVREYLEAHRGGRYSANNIARALDAKAPAVLSALEALRAAGELKAEPIPPCSFVYFMPINAVPDRRQPWTLRELTGWETHIRNRMAMCMAVRRF
ncbi:hypothetical protein D9M68_264530 [compost metagenome]